MPIDEEKDDFCALADPQGDSITEALADLMHHHIHHSPSFDCGITAFECRAYTVPEVCGCIMIVTEPRLVAMFRALVSQNLSLAKSIEQSLRDINESKKKGN